MRTFVIAVISVVMLVTFAVLYILDTLLGADDDFPID